MNSFTHLIRQMIYDVFYSFVNHDTGFLNVSVCFCRDIIISVCPSETMHIHVHRNIFFKKDQTRLLMKG